MPEGSELYQKGAAKRRQLMGDAAVEAAAKGIYSDPVMQECLGKLRVGEVSWNLDMLGRHVLRDRIADALEPLFERCAEETAGWLMSNSARITSVMAPDDSSSAWMSSRIRLRTGSPRMSKACT